MNEPVSIIRLCPRCKTERPLTEAVCEGEYEGDPCGWPLFDVEPEQAGTRREDPAVADPQPQTEIRICTNGHPLGADDFVCMQCGSMPATAAAGEEADAPDEPASPTVIGKWTLVRRVTDIPAEAPFESFVVEGDGQHALLTLYRLNHEPDPGVQSVLKRIHADNVPTMLETGRYGGRAYEVTEHITGGTLQALGFVGAGDHEALKTIVDEIQKALSSFLELGVRHRDINPRTVAVRTRDPLDLVITGFGSARLSDFDLEAVAPLELTRYSAPEAIVGAVSAASDWWSLGVIVLEQITAGKCFENVNDQAFRLHVVTRGLAIPRDLRPDVQLLLRGLLARDPLERWSADQVRKWLAGEQVEAPAEAGGEKETGPSIELGGRDFTSPDSFALAAAEAANWDAGKDLTLRGSVATWLESRKSDRKVVAWVRRMSADDAIPEELRHSLVLMGLNTNLPLTLKGDIVTPAWLLSHPVEGYDLITGQLPSRLEELGPDREPWLVRLSDRNEFVRERLKLLEIEADEDRLRVALLSTSRANLEAERNTRRQIYPETDHPGLASILDRDRISDEELVILVSAKVEQFIPLETLAVQTVELGVKERAPVPKDFAQEQLLRPRRDIFADIATRTANFARCGIERIDDWADTFRVEQRLPLTQAVVLLHIPAELWKELPKQKYIGELLKHFEKKVSVAISRGPLVRFTIGKTTPRVDLHSLGTATLTGDAILNHVLSRTPAPRPLDPSAYFGDENKEARLRRLISHAEMFRRDTGLNGLTLGFPFLLSRDGRGSAGTGRETKTRIAPIVLWPIALEFSQGGRLPTICYRKEEEPRLNPALETILGPQLFAKWGEAFSNSIKSRGSTTVEAVMDVIGSFATPKGNRLVKLPSPEVKVAKGTMESVPAAVLFNAEFTGQSIVADLKDMNGRPLGGTAVDAMLRVSTGGPELEELAQVSEREKHLVVASDPSQESAVIRSRQEPGLLVEGPPGTGKSQTIVNIVADAIGRKQTVLVVCQKQAALKVVQKRLEAEDLGNRLFMIDDPTADRTSVIKALREQLDQLKARPANVTALRRAREQNAIRIDGIETEINKQHAALHRTDERSSFTYRELLGALIELEDQGPSVDLAGIRQMFKDLTLGEVTDIEQTCASVSRQWLESKYEGSELHVLKKFPVDTALAAAIASDIERFEDVERDRMDAALSTEPGFDVDDPAPYQAWLTDGFRRLRDLPDPTRTKLMQWFDLFWNPGGELGRGDAAIKALEAASDRLSELNFDSEDDRLTPQIVKAKDEELEAVLKDARKAAEQVGFFGKLMRRRSRSRTKAYLKTLGEPFLPARAAALRDAVELELALRPHRRSLRQVIIMLAGSAPDRRQSLQELIAECAACLNDIRPIKALMTAVSSSPRVAEAEEAVRGGTVAALEAVRRRYDGALKRYAAKVSSLKTLDSLAEWFEPGWLAERHEGIRNGQSTVEAVAKISAALPTLPAYQAFRVRADGFSPAVMRIFTFLRVRELQLTSFSGPQLPEVVSRSLRREALLAWKGKFETESPELTIEADEIVQKVERLADLDGQVRSANKDLLRQDIPNGIGASSAWEDITRLTGKRARRMRELVETGVGLGIFQVRPIWLMNPDVASQILPLKGGLFDLVVFDEASQMPVEQAIPAMFRGKRVVVAGDEKQMPPSSFFASRVDGAGDDDDDSADSLDDSVTETERAAREESWNRREIKDCPDLLQLGRSVLPATTLQIHYRSKYRELIGYSNSAFYQGKLSVPARHPETEILRAKPIEVIRADGVYEGQTNPEEADRVVEFLAKLWRENPNPPSVGVVTFNRKQADVVEDALQIRADNDEAFRKAKERESDRIQNNEDMRFFVKNVENVQGDERDIIVFSTTFGRDKHGGFRRNFGVLGQSGGERRLNVAVTRAREKVVLVTSMPITDVSDWMSSGRLPNKPRDYLQAYLDYASRLSGGDVEIVSRFADRMQTKPEKARDRRGMSGLGDGFKTSVERFVQTLGYNPIATEDGDAFGLDFAVERPGTGLFGIGIECDAPRHELLTSARAREIWRPSVLRRAIPTIHRVSSRAWYHYPNEERAKLKKALETALGGEA